MINPNLNVLSGNLPNNILARLQALENAVYGEQRAESERFFEGQISAELFLFPAQGVVDTDPTSPEYTGGFACGEGVTFGSETFTFGYVKLGVLQWGGKDSDAAFWAGRGAIRITENGLLFTTGNAMTIDDGNDYGSFGFLPGIGAQMFGATGYTEHTFSNQDFESGSLTGWTVTGAAAVSTAAVHSGSYSCRLNKGKIVGSIISAPGAPTAKFIELWVYCDAFAVKPQVSVSLLYYDAGGVYQATSGELLILNTPGQWQRCIVPVDNVLTYPKFAVEINESTADVGGSVYVDDVRVFSAAAEQEILFKGSRIYFRNGNDDAGGAYIHPSAISQLPWGINIGMILRSGNYVSISSEGLLKFYAAARIDWQNIQANNVTLSAGTTANVVADLKVARDSLAYVVQEAAATPGISLIVEFTGVTMFQWVSILGHYTGTHFVRVQMLDWTAGIYKDWDTIEAGGGYYENHDFVVPDPLTWIGTGGNAGKVRIRFIHPSAGNAAHYLHLDCVSLWK